MSRPALAVRSLSKSYGGTTVLHDVSLTVEAGAVYGLLGPNGSGKTTTLSCALGLLAPDSGTVEVLGLAARRIYASAGKVGAVFDRAELVGGLTVTQNLRYARGVLGHGGGRTIDEALALVGGTRLANKRARSLSLGESRRTSIARALLGSPELLVLDEPLAGLDTPGVTAMIALFRRLKAAGVTILLSSHRMLEIEGLVTHVAVLADGRCVREGEVEDVLGAAGRTLAVRAEPLEKASALLASFGSLDESDSTFRLDADGIDPADVNRKLVEAGCRVTHLAVTRRNLQQVFEELVARGGAS